MTPRPSAVTGTGIQLSFLAGVEATGGAYSVIEYELPPASLGAPPHYHKKLVESFYVLSGVMTLFESSGWRPIHAGQMATVRPGTVHAFRNDSDKPLRALIVAAPGSHDIFLRKLADWARQQGQWPPAGLAELIAFGAEFDVHYVL